MCIERGVDKVVVYLYMGILINLKKKRIWVTWAEVDEPAACYIEWSKSTRENQILYINAYMDSRKMALINLFTGQEERHREQVSGYIVRRRGKVTWDTSNETQYITKCKILTDS